VSEVGDLVVLRRVHADGRAQQEREQATHGSYNCARLRLLLLLIGWLRAIKLWYYSLHLDLYGVLLLIGWLREIKLWFGACGLEVVQILSLHLDLYVGKFRLVN
jgi:hypothetical protein